MTSSAARPSSCIVLARLASAIRSAMARTRTSCRFSDCQCTRDLRRAGLDAADGQDPGRQRRGAWMWPWPSGWAASWAGRSSSTGAPAPIAPGIACPRGVATWSSASRMDPGRRARGLERPLCRRPVRAGGPARSHGVRSLADLAASGSGSWPAPWPSRRKTTLSPGFKSREELLDGLPPAKLDAAFLDADFAAWYLHEHPKLALRLVNEYVPRERWNMALAVRARDHELLVEINRALAQLAESGELRKIYADYGVPFHRPFEAPSEPQAERPTPGAGSATAASWSSAWTPPILPYSSARGRSPGFRRRAGAGPGRSAARQAPDRMARRPARDRGRAAHPAPVRPGLRRGRRRQRRRRRRGAGGKVLYSRPYYGTGYVLVRRKNGPRVRSLAELKGEVAAPGHRGRLGRRLSPPPAGLPPPPVPQPVGRAEGLGRRRHRLTPTSGPTSAGPCTPRPTWTWRSSRATSRRTAGTSPSPCAGATTSSSSTSTRRSTH